MTIEQFGDVLEPKDAAEPILSRPVRGALTEWLTEIWAADELREVGLSPRMRAMFSGPPGVGKTTLAHHLSARLGMRLLKVNSETLVNCYIGESAKNMARLFDAAAREKGLALFFDEIDGIGGARNGEGRSNAAREVDDMVNVLLRRIEVHKGLVIAATNLPEVLDRALWRRFDLQIGLELPGRFERERIIARYLDPYGLPAAELRALAEAAEGASPALLRQFCEGVKRNLIVGPKVGWPMQRDAVIDRVIAAVTPPPGVGKPQLWTQGAAARAVQGMTWPLPKAAEIREEASAAQAEERPDVIPFGRGGRAAR